MTSRKIWMYFSVPGQSPDVLILLHHTEHDVLETSQAKYFIIRVHSVVVVVIIKKDNVT